MHGSAQLIVGIYWIPVVIGTGALCALCALCMSLDRYELSICDMICYVRTLQAQHSTEQRNKLSMIPVQVATNSLSPSLSLHFHRTARPTNSWARRGREALGRVWFADTVCVCVCVWASSLLCAADCCSALASPNQPDSSRGRWNGISKNPRSETGHCCASVYYLLLDNWITGYIAG
ncbi:hypothetical protein BZA05DRAFT_398560 [Tricharina praecox]|uniref:uncharacterized protein n=1 Tax=Tricharina praecox TaxID=43433 RepID=UPI00221E73E9|nr:uncharacterized protein BZA05DRAFT_398560 [Tricharina praecox]KAI5851980.1 hypothetical protein BZA05DRAFT_398560 [Tricharina praecox]